MGCTESTKNNTLQPIAQPEGPAKDPLETDGDIVDAIIHDPHLHFFQRKIEQVIMPIRKKQKEQSFVESVVTKTNSNTNSNVSVNSKQHIPIKTNRTMIQRYATSDRKEHDKYVETVNNALENNEASVTNILGYMIQEIADYRQGKKVQEKFSNDTYAALKCFIYLYTGHYTYKKINSQLRRNQYEKISKVIGIVKKQLEQFNKQKFARKLKANIKYGQFLNLYRGIPKPDKTMTKGKRLYWKGFTSTSLDTNIASRFGRYLFVITLDKVSPHAYMVVPEQLSQFKQQQIILFPYLYFQCTNVQNFTSGARYDCKQVSFNDQ